MDLEKVDRYLLKAAKLKSAVEKYKYRKEILENSCMLEVKSHPHRINEKFEITEGNNFIGMDSPAVIAFRTILDKEIVDKLEKAEKELAEFIKKGITTND